MLPLFLHKLHLGAFWAGSLTALPLAIIAVVSMPSGRIADRFGHRTTLLVALLLLSIGAFVPVADPSRIGLFIDVSTTGVAIGLAQPTLAKLARSMNPMNPTLPTSLYANALVMGGFIASLITTSVLLPLMGRLSWTGVFMFWGCICLLTSVGWLIVFRGERRQGIDVQVSAPTPFSIREPGFIPIAVAFAAQGGVFYALVTWLPDYFVRHGWPLSTASYPLAAVSFGSILGSIVSPWMLKLGRGFRRPFVTASLLMALSLGGLLCIPSWAYLWSIFIGFTTALIFTLGMAAPAEIVPNLYVGRASGILLTIGYIGAVLGPLGYGFLLPLGEAFPMGYLILISLTIAAAAMAIPTTLHYQSGSRDTRTA